MLHTTEYTDPAALDRQIKRLFKASPQYMGHERMVLHINEHFPLPATGESCFIARTKDRCKVYVNSCPHRSYKLVTHRKTEELICCAAHGLVCKVTGEVIKVPRFDQCPKIDLHEIDVSSWHGMLFRTAQDLDKWFGDIPESIKGCFELEDYDFHSVSETSESVIPTHWLIPLEVFDDVLHVPVIHPALAAFAIMDSLKWDYFTNGNCQYIEINRPLIFNQDLDPIRRLSKPPQMGLLKYVTALRDILKVRPELADDPSLHHISWISLYPGMTIESYPFMHVITDTQPLSVNTTRQNVEFYFKAGLPKELAAALMEGAIDFYNQTAFEDNVLSSGEYKGIEFLARYGIEKRGPTHNLFEAGTQHRHAWMQRKLHD